MSSTVHTARHIPGQGRPYSLLQALANVRGYCVKLAAPFSKAGPKHEQDRTTVLTAPSAFVNTARSSSSSGSSMPRLAGALPKQQSSLWLSTSRQLPAVGSCRAASVGLTRMFGGQSVVPWELALFLVEEVR